MNISPAKARIFSSATLCAAIFLFAFPSAGNAQQRAEGKLEKGHLAVAIAATGPLYLPLLVAQEAGYFAKRGLSLNISQVSATASAQGLVSGAIDIYQGGAAVITANLAGSDLIYVASAVDRSTLVLFGQKGINSIESLRGKSVATTSPGAFGEIAVRRSAKERGMQVGKDIKLLYHRSPQEAFATFVAGNADGLVITPPQSNIARSKGYPVIVDYYERGLRIVGPGVGVSRAFSQGHLNTLKAYLMSYLDGVKKTLDDPLFAKKINGKYNKVSDAEVLDEDYQQGLKIWNRDMTVDPEAIRIVLEESAIPKANEADPKRFYDNSIIREINRDYASKLFPGEIK